MLTAQTVKHMKMELGGVEMAEGRETSTKNTDDKEELLAIQFCKSDADNMGSTTSLYNSQ